MPGNLRKACAVQIDLFWHGIQNATMPKDAKAKTKNTPAGEVGFVIKNIIPEGFTDALVVDDLVTKFFEACEPLEKDDLVYVFVDARTGARFCECHIRASKLIPLATTDVPIDPEEQEEYRANRDLVEDHQAFAVMKDDAVKRRSFSNLVIEYSTDYNEEFPLKRRRLAIRKQLLQRVLSGGCVGVRLSGVPLVFNLVVSVLTLLPHTVRLSCVSKI